MKRIAIAIVLCSLLLTNAHAMNVRLSKHFTQSEFVCHCCGECRVSMVLIIKLEELRTKLGVPIIITSGFRCASHNAAIGGAKHSQHLYGNAVDIKVKGYTPAQVAKAAKEVGFTWTKVYNTWTHVDVR